MTMKNADNLKVQETHQLYLRHGNGKIKVDDEFSHMMDNIFLIKILLL